jgi:Zn-dependent protease/predicted transcriptional regulator
MFQRAFRLPFRLLGIPILLDWTFLIILPILAWLIGHNAHDLAVEFGLPADERLQQGAWPYIFGFVAAIGLFVSVIIHELGHAVMARAYGVRTQNITLWLLGGVAQFDEMPRQRGAEAVVALVGPIVSFALGMLFWILDRSTPMSLPGTKFIFVYLCFLNIVLAVFNLLPAMPLDGGRILRSLLALRMSHLRATQVSARISKVLAVLLGLLGLLSFNFFLIAVAFFIYMAVNAEAQSSLILELLHGIQVSDLMTRTVKTVPPDLTVADLTVRMLQEHHLGFPVVEDNHVRGLITLAQLQGADPAAPISQLMETHPNTIRPDASALDAFHQMSGNNFGRLIVIDGDDTIAGILTKTDLMRALQLRGVGLSMVNRDGFEEALVGEEAAGDLVPHA